MTNVGHDAWLCLGATEPNPDPVEATELNPDPVEATEPNPDPLSSTASSLLNGTTPQTHSFFTTQRKHYKILFK